MLMINLYQHTVTRTKPQAAFLWKQAKMLAQLPGISHHTKFLPLVQMLRSIKRSSHGSNLTRSKDYGFRFQRLPGQFQEKTP